MTLDEIAQKYGTDKATVFTRTYAKPHGYTPHFEKWFEPLRFRAVKFLEIGIGGGESARTWLEYFSQGQIHGVDIVQDTNPWNSTREHPNERYRFMPGDQGKDEFWKSFLETFGPAWDIIIDDGSHCASDVLTTFKCLWPVLAAGGLYCIEDLGVTYGDGSIFVSEQHNHMNWLHGLVDEMNRGDSQYASICFSKELAIIRKI